MNPNTPWTREAERPSSEADQLQRELPDWAWPRPAPRSILGLRTLWRWLAPLKDTIETAVETPSPQLETRTISSS